MDKWGAILLSALIFGIYHFIVDKIPVTALLGVLLGYICWQTRSILPGMIVHALHNGITTLIPMVPRWPDWTGLNNPEASRLPLQIVLPAVGLFLVGLLVLPRFRPRQDVIPETATY